MGGLFMQVRSAISRVAQEVMTRRCLGAGQLKCKLNKSGL